MARFIHAACLAIIVLAVMTGCTTPAKRAREHSAAFGKLAPADQRLVLCGRVRQGLAREAVLIAWGVPDLKNEAGSLKDGKERAAVEIWTYRQQVTTHAAIASYDQWQPGNTLVAPGMLRFTARGYGFGGIGYEGWLLGRPRIQYTDSYVRRAAFVNGKLDSFKTWYGEYPPPS